MNGRLAGLLTGVRRKGVFAMLQGHAGILREEG